MDFDWKRWKTWDFGVGILFVLTIIGVSLTWWKAAGAGDLGDLDVGGIFGGLSDWLSISGWSFGSVVFLFICALVALLLVLLKAFLPANRALPGWYREGLGVMVLGGIMTLIAFLRLAVAPGGGHSAWDPGAGGFITLIASVLMLAAGFLMWRDKTGDYGSSTLPKIPVTTKSSAPGPGAGAFCVGCGAPLAPGATQCGNCGKPV
jgi:hypothetical protein